MVNNDSGALDFKGKDLLFGETDGSSYEWWITCHSRSWCILVDPSSPIFLRDDTMFIPAVVQHLMVIVWMKNYQFCVHQMY